MAGISVSGLISNSFDWKSVVDQLIQIDSAPIARMQSEESKNIDRLASLATLQTRFTELQTSVKALAADGLFNGRTATSSTPGSTWAATASNNTPVGGYVIAVSQLATAARRVGASSIAQSLSATNDVSALTLASLPTATAVSEGRFSVNGRTVDVAVTDTLQDVFTKISAATGGNVTASYDSTTDKVTLSAADHGEIVLGAANDTSNFLSVMRLENNGGESITSSATLGSLAINATLASSRLGGTFTGLDGTGGGQFRINGVDIDFNVNTDTLTSLLGKINGSGAGVSASYDSAQDRVILTNTKTGDLGLGLEDRTGNLLGMLGLTAGFDIERGQNAQFTVNGGSQRTSTTNTLDQNALGVTGLTVTANTEGTQVITVSPGTEAMKSAIQDFVTKFNAVQTFVEAQTKITKTPDGKVQTALLSDNREVQTMASQLRSMAFGQVSGLSGTVKRLESLGIDFSSTAETLSIKDPAKLATALATKTADVAAFFGAATTGFVAKFDAFLKQKLDDKTGPLATQMATLNKQNSNIDKQIAALNTRLANQRQLLTSSFLAMQNAQSMAQQQQQTLTNFTNSMSSSKS